MERQDTHTSSESSDEDMESTMHQFFRRMSTVAPAERKNRLKEGYLTIQSGSFQRWKRRYFTLFHRKLFFSKGQQAQVCQEIDLQNATVADRSIKTSHVFTVITPHRKIVLSTESRKETEEWLSAIQSAITQSHKQQDCGLFEHGMHRWFSCSHSHIRPTYCNVCSEAIRSRCLSCDICEFKAHKHCAKDACNNCKWVTQKTIPPDKLSSNDQMAMEHQWLEGNLPANSKCAVCDKAFGSVKKLQDWRCLWCKATVHADCLSMFSCQCSLGPNRVSILPPTAIRAWDMNENGRAEAVRPPGSSPLLVFVNSKSGDNQGVKFLRRFKQLLNPSQVFDLITTGPFVGLHLFQSFESFRILISGGDGSVGWVLMAIDKLGLTNRCQVGILPLGTGNDLARVLGWGATCDDDSLLPQILHELELSGVKMLDRWSIQTKPHSPSNTAVRRKLPALPSVYERKKERRSSTSSAAAAELEHSVASHLGIILSAESRDHDVIDSTRVLCEHIQKFVSLVCEQQTTSKSSEEGSLKEKCHLLNAKLLSLMSTLKKESCSLEDRSISLESGDDLSGDCEEIMKHLAAVIERTSDKLEDVQLEMTENRPTEVCPQDTASKMFRSRDAVMARANSLKKAVKQIIDHVEETLDQQVNQNTTDTLPFTRPSIVVEEIPLLDGTMDEGIGTTTTASDRDNEPSTEEEPLPSSQRNSGTSDAFEEATISVKLDAVASTKASKKKKRRKVTRARFTSQDSGVGSSIVSRNTKLKSSVHARSESKGGITSLSAALLVGANALVAPITAPATFEDDKVDSPATAYSEINVMNNYFGIGLDAKISLDFHNKREEHPEKCRNRMLNRMWYGVLSGKQIINQTYKNLDQRIKLECDGKPVVLPTIQGIVVLNIPSYMGGVNFWGTEKDKEGFFAPSFDDRMLEVVAVTSCSQMAQAYVLGVQSHRLAQCRSLKITVLGNEPVPCQVDGEAWLQEPGQMKMTHKNRSQMLARNKAFYSTLQSWRCQGGSGAVAAAAAESSIMPSSTSMPQLLPSQDLLALRPLIEATTALVSSVKVAAISNEVVECELLPLAHHCTYCIEQLFPDGSPSEHANTGQRDDLIQRVKQLIQESGWFVNMKELGVTRVGHVKRLLSLISSLRESQTSSH